MSRSLEEFLSLPDVDSIEEEVFVSKRLGTFKVKAMTADEHGEYQRRAKGKFNKDGIEFDSAKFYIMIVAGQTIEPDFRNAELLKKAGCSTANEFIKKKLLPGEIAELATQIIKISGFDNDINEDINEAKN
jgi:hypothetical protein